MSRPLVVDIDGTLSRPDRSIEGRVIDTLHDWDDPVVIATGKAFPYPVALCDYIGLPIRVIAENGGVVATEDTVAFTGDPTAVNEFVDAYRAAGYALGWGEADLVNRWRETEVAIHRNQEREPIETIAAEYGLVVIDSGYAYHITTPEVNKGRGLERLCENLGLDAGGFVAVGDSENDVSTFKIVELSFAVANADALAREAADTVTEGAYGDGLLEALREL